MKQNDYKTAMDKIKATEELKARVLRAVRFGKKAKKKINYKKYIALASMLVLVMAASYLPSLRKEGGYNAVKSPTNNNTEFKIIGKGDANDEHILVLYLDGFSYEHSGWTSYLHNNYYIKDIDKIKGKKIGEINLDLKGLRYEGIPPDFSSTYKVGTQVYEIKGRKKSHALLLEDGDTSFILYNSGKALIDLKRPIDMKVGEVIDMMTNLPSIKEVELRREENGAWMRTSYDKDLLELLNTELPKAQIYNYEEDGRPSYESIHTNYRVPVNFGFQDGAVLHAQVYPEINLAYIFGGYIHISEDLSNKFKDLNKLGDQYPRFRSLLGYEGDNIGYFQIQNYLTGENIISSEPLWSASGFYWLFDFYALDKTLNLEGKLVASIKLGQSDLNFIEIEVYEGEDKDLFLKIKGENYRIVKGGLRLKDIVDFQEAYIS